MSTTMLFKPQNSSVTEVTLPTEDFPSIKSLLVDKINNAPLDFFTGTPLVLNCNNLEDTDANWLRQIKQEFTQLGLQLIGVSNHHFSSADLLDAGLSDIEFLQSKNSDEVNENRSKIELEKSSADLSSVQAQAVKTKVIHGNVRSGQQIYAQGCDLTVIGIVSAGAEIVADGNITVLGSLRGRAFAGALGDTESYIYCKEMKAELISIAGQYQNMEQIYPHRDKLNVLITLNKNETMSVESV